MESIIRHVELCIVFVPLVEVFDLLFKLGGLLTALMFSCLLQEDLEVFQSNFLVTNGNFDLFAVVPALNLFKED